jgi:hypothetical protein
MRDEALAKLNELRGLAYTSGANTAAGFANGINDNVWRIQAAAYNAASQWRDVFPSSEPKDPNSPFRGITKAWGFMDTLAKGLASTSGAVGSTLAGALGSPIMPAIGTPGLAGAGAGGGSVVNINLTVNGDLTSDREAGVVNAVTRAWNVATGVTA